MSDLHIAALLDALQLRYARALDEHDMVGWAACFAAEASYICTSRENIEERLEVAMMMDDSRARIEDRVKAVTKVWTGTFEDYQTRHIVQRFDHGHLADERWSMQSTFLITYTNEAADTKILGAGIYRDEIVIEAGQPKFAVRVAILDGDAPARYLAYPI